MRALSSTVALPLISTPSIASGVSTVHSRPDLAGRFDEFYALWKHQREADALESAARDAAERTGQPFAWSDPDNEAWSKINEGGSQLIDEIMSQRATSLGDIALQARASAMDNVEYWFDRSAIEYMNAGPVAFRQLVERICELAGVEVFPGLQTAPLMQMEREAEPERVYTEPYDPAAHGLPPTHPDFRVRKSYGA
ncbi:hypothetical protein [Bradyrhizobium sp. CW1]|uniref:hypothetical protein n=1 Tax=Bradyrhizobium sp. CW1 TaxID=2782686 RepID=UPI001FFFDF8B|nr:hypothetical protein [Bradyrhizobium sp. CW1]UPJ27085.1 hypothetical protein IVB54_36680 [Bradyrhizobium sp. CW1]